MRFAFGLHRPHLWMIVATIAAIATVVQPPGAAAEGASDVEAKATLDKIARCLKDGKEVVLLADRVHCETYRKTKEFLAENKIRLPHDIDIATICPADKNAKAPDDFRRLPANAIQTLVNDYKEAIGPLGIRINGAVFCERVDIVGLSLNYSLVLDRSIFLKGLGFHGFTTKGDLSVDRSFVFEDFRLIRSRIEGSLFGEEAFLQRVIAQETNFGGSLMMRESVFFGTPVFSAVKVSNEFSLRASALSALLIQFSDIGGIVDISHSQARCAYHINKNQIGTLLMRQTGFGTVAAPPTGSTSNTLYTWRQEASFDTLTNIRNAAKRGNGAEKVADLIAKPEACALGPGGEFQVFDNTVRSSVCVNHFHWLAPPGGMWQPPNFKEPAGSSTDPLTVLAFNGTTVSGNLIVNLWGEGHPIHDEVSARLHRFEAIGVKTAGLIFNFTDYKHPDAKSSANKIRYVTRIDDLSFDRIHTGRIACDYRSDASNQPELRNEKRGSVAETHDVRLPTTAHVIEWLDLNEVRSTQPFAAFVAAFTRAGVDVTDLRVARADRELCARTCRWVTPPTFLCPPPQKASAKQGAAEQCPPLPASTSKASAASEDSGPFDQFAKGVSAALDVVSDAVALVFRWFLRFVADHGFRPGQVLWWIAASMIVCLLYFWLRLRIVGFEPKTDPPAAPANRRVWPVGLIFLFDRLIPVYQIRPEHYRIEKYYRWVSAKPSIARPARRRRRGRGANAPNAVRIWWMWFRVEEADLEVYRTRIDRILVALKIVGAILAIFLTAAIGTLVVR